MHLLPVVVIEPDEIWRELLMRHLQPLGVTVSHSVSGESGVRLIQQVLPRVIVSEILLPDFTAETIISLAREFFHNIPFVVVTHEASRQAAELCLKHGVVDYILKSELPVSAIADRIYSASRIRERTPTW